MVALIDPKLFDTRIGIYLGLGLSQESTAELIGCAVNTVRSHIDRNGTFILQVKTETEIGAAKTLAKKLTELEAQQSMSAVAWQELKKLLERKESDALKLQSIREVLDREQGKSVTRIKMSSTNEQVHSIDDATMDAITALADEMRQLNQRREPLRIEATVISDGSAESN